MAVPWWGSSIIAMAPELRARLDWKDAVQLGRFSLSPYAVYTWMKTKVDGCTETGGGFPAYFASLNISNDDMRVGLAAKTSQITQNWTRETVNLDRRFTDKVAMTLGARGRPVVN